MDISKRVKCIPAHERVAQIALNISQRVFYIAQDALLDICVQYRQEHEAVLMLRSHILQHLKLFLRNPMIPPKLKISYALYGLGIPFRK